MFECNSCGACCKLLVEEFAPELDRGDGICRHLKANRCSTYEERPNKCRQGHLYESVSQFMSRDEYDELGMKRCVELKAIVDAKFK